MTNPAAIAGTFAKIVPVTTRGQVQLVIELPIEGADEALKALGGYPQPGKEVPVAVARLTEAAAKKTVPTPEAKQGRKAWADLLPSQQAGIRCGDPQFQRWARKAAHDGDPPFLFAPSDDDPLQMIVSRWVRMMCGVSSRTQLTTDEAAKQKWLELDERYQRDSGLMAEQTI